MFIPSYNTHDSIEGLLIVKPFRHSPRISCFFPNGRTNIVLLAIYLYSARSQGWVTIALHYLLPSESSWDETVIQPVQISWKPKPLIEMGESNRLIHLQLTKCKSCQQMKSLNLVKIKLGLPSIVGSRHRYVS